MGMHDNACDWCGRRVKHRDFKGHQSSCCPDLLDPQGWSDHDSDYVKSCVLERFGSDSPQWRILQYRFGWAPQGTAHRPGEIATHLGSGFSVARIQGTIKDVLAGVARSTLSAIPVEVLYRSEGLLVVNKGAGTPCQPVGYCGAGLLNLVAGFLNREPAQGVEAAQGVDDGRATKRMKTVQGPAAKPFLVHRLDTDTSGVVLIALDKKSCAQAASDFEQRRVTKEYIAICLGMPCTAQGTAQGTSAASPSAGDGPSAGDDGTRELADKRKLKEASRASGADGIRFLDTPGCFVVDSPIQVVHLPTVEGQDLAAQGPPAAGGGADLSATKITPFRAVIGQGGQAARTRFEVVDVNQAANLTVVRAWPETGRTHQIRVHLASIGMPIVGDELYGGGAPQLLQRHGLHARRLQFQDAGRQVEAVAPLPGDMTALLLDQFDGSSRVREGLLGLPTDVVQANAESLERSNHEAEWYLQQLEEDEWASQERPWH